MAVFHCDYRSRILAGNVNFNVVLPEQCVDDIPFVLLLHGLAGNQDDWLRFTSIERYAIERSIAVVMPNADKSFYSDMVHGRKYYSYVTGELLDYVRRVFPLSRKREKTFVAGLSMGGYGAFKIALGASDQFAAAASLSGVPDMVQRIQAGRFPEVRKAIWGNNYMETLPGSSDDPYELVRRLEASDLPKPWLFQACGTEDTLYDNNLLFKEFIENRGFVYEFHEGPGAHTWDVWDYWIVHAIDFFKRYMAEYGVEQNVLPSYPQSIAFKP